jgi:hypothetical protein
MATAESTSQPPPESRSPVPDAVRVQILATEHWSLLATRSMTWSEVMSRITIHLTICSASLVVLALVVQAFGFGTAFQVLSVGLASAMLVLGTLTSIRVMNASVDDQALVAGMNRLRAGYLSIDPSIRTYLVASWRDDAAGVMATLTMGQPRTLRRHVVGSTPRGWQYGVLHECRQHNRRRNRCRFDHASCRGRHHPGGCAGEPRCARVPGGHGHPRSPTVRG